MSLLEKIQNKPRDAKIRLMWAILCSVVVLLIGIWVLFNRMGVNINKASVFFSEQAKDIKAEGQQLYEKNK